jgi:tetratricopeptide (TPR) repeat protein
LLHDYPHAAAALEQSVSLRPNSWRAHWLAGAAYFQQGEYQKSREQCEEALRVGQDKAGSVRFLLGEAHAALGEREAALAALDQFVREQPNVPQAATANKLMEQLRTVNRPNTETAAANTGAPAGAPVRVSTTNLSDITMLPIAPAIETNWAPPDVDEERLSTDAGTSCALKEVTEAAGARVEELVKNVDRFTATEEMEHESLSPLGVRLSKETRSFNYLVAISKMGTRGLDVQEYRDGSVSTQPFPAHVATLGLPMLALVFHSYYRDEFEFKCEGRGEWRGRPAWVVHFRQKDNEMSEMRVYRVNGMSFPVHLKGRAWIDAENSQILAMEADMVRTVPEIRLVRDHQMIEYGPVEFQKANTPMWLPKSADWYCNLAGQRYHRRHSFSHFLLFSVEDIQKIGTPKETRQK